MILSDRREKYYKDYSNYCEEGCNYIGYNYSIKRVICQCEIKNEINYEITKIEFNKNDISSFLRISTYANFAALKCYKLLFCNEGQKNNYGSYLLILFIILYLVFTIIFYDNYKLKIKNIFNSALFKRSIKNKNPPKKGMQIIDSNNELRSQNIEIENSTKANIFFFSKKEAQNNSMDLKSTNIKFIFDKTLKNENNSIIEYKMDKFANKIKDNNSHLAIESGNNKKISNFNDEELNLLLYEEAINYDKRLYWQYYISLIKKKNIFLFTFFRKK